MQDGWALRIGLAPMEGVLDPLMRQIITKRKGIDCCTTEFIRVTDKLLPKHIFYRYAPELHSGSHTKSKTPVLIQLLGGKPDWMAENARRAKELGAYGIDINFGCPAKTVNRHDGGAALLKKPERLSKTIATIKKAVGKDFHVSAKVRLGFSDKSLIKEIAEACSEASWMTVHARTKEEGYAPPAHHQFIAQMKKHSSIPIFANGDIWSLKDYRKCVEDSDCEDVMIGRGLLRNPFLAQEIKEGKELPQEEKQKKTLEMIISYLEDGAQVYGKLKALNRVKQWLRMCTKNTDFEKTKTLKSLEEMRAVLKEKQ